ncbi:MAG: T9SS type A sorting domain-containing protein [Ignavibacteria bacterium]|nr:T9SS type A sorting domain-containing protein [Ignavibacteria bacterium]
MKISTLFSIVLTLFFVSTLFAQLNPPANLIGTYKPSSGTMHYGFVELKWQYTSLAATFKVYRKNPDATEFTLLKSGIRSLYFNDYNVQSNKTYEYYVVAYTSTQTSDPSNTVSVTTPPAPDWVKFTSTPVKTGNVGVAYSYDANASSNDSTAVITYSLSAFPTGMTINSGDGVIDWTPISAGHFSVKIKAESNKGGYAYQSYSISVTAPMGIVQGVVTDEVTNLPIKKGVVYFYGSTSTRYEYTYTDTNGNYSKNLQGGTYKIKFSKHGYITEYFDNKTSLETADPVVVAVGSPVTASAALGVVPPPITFTISGSVLNAANEPVRSTVQVFGVTDGSITGTSMCPITKTDSLGNYSFTLVGNKSYVVYAKPFDVAYYPEYWDNKRTFLEADKILLNENKSNINFVMDLKPVYANGVEGTVRHFASMTGVPAHVTVFKLSSGRFKVSKSVRSDSLGVYALQNLEPGMYILHAVPPRPYLPGYYKEGGIAWSWRQADTVTVTETSILQNININLRSRTDTGSAIANGKIITSSDANVSGGIVYALDVNGNVVDYGISEGDGSYILSEIPAGTYNFIVDKVDYNSNTIYNVTFDYSDNSSKVINLLINPATPTGVDDNPILKPISFALGQNYPNPFNPATNINFSIKEKSFVTLKVYNLLGKEVANLVEQVKEQGDYKIQFSASELPSGVYMYQLKSGRNTITKKMLLMK